jgi:hypothetical protein
LFRYILSPLSNLSQIREIIASALFQNIERQLGVFDDGSKLQILTTRFDFRANPPGAAAAWER